jgi:hypothetical protein
LGHQPPTGSRHIQGLFVCQYWLRSAEIDEGGSESGREGGTTADKCMRAKHLYSITVSTKHVQPSTRLTKPIITKYQYSEVKTGLSSRL